MQWNCLVSFLLLLITAPSKQVHSFRTMDTTISFLRSRNQMTCRSWNSKCHRFRNPIETCSALRRIPSQQLPEVPPSFALYGKKRSHEKKDIIDAIDGAIVGVVDGLWGILMRPLELGFLQFPAIYPLTLTLVAVRVDVERSFWFAIVFTVVDIIARRLIGRDDGNVDDAQVPRQPDFIILGSMLYGFGNVYADPYLLLLSLYVSLVAWVKFIKPDARSNDNDDDDDLSSSEPPEQRL